MITIVYILPYLEKGGTETHVLELIRGFTKRNYNIILISPPGSRLSQFEKYKITYIAFETLNKNLFKGINSFKNALKKASKYKPDIIHVHAAAELIILTKLFIRNIPIIFTNHGYPRNFSFINYRISAFINNIFSKKIITVSDDEKTHMEKAGFNKKKCLLIYNGIEKPKNYSIDNLPKKVRKISQSKTIIATVARLEKEKGISYLLQSLSKLKKKDVHLIIIGSGSYEEYLKNEAKILSIKNITFTGFISNIHDYLEIVDIFVLPSLQESFGLVCIEAMAHKIPVIAFSVGGIPEVIIDNTTGFLIPYLNIEMLADKIETLIKNKSLAKKLGEAGFKRYKKLFTLETMIQKTDKVYKKILDIGEYYEND